MSDCCDGTCVENHKRHSIPKAKLNDQSSIKKTYAIVSGKGGVGKSFITSLLASRLNKLKHKVGIMDGDITGPSIGQSFNIHQGAYGDGNSLVFPAITKSGIKIISSNMLIHDEKEPIVWRGTLTSSLILQFYSDILWEDLDYLLIDMPPGTSDINLTVFQSIPLDGIIIVSTPQDLVSMIVNKAINMAKMMNIKIIGIIENMSYFECPHCKKKTHVFGNSHLDKFAKDNDIEILGRLPFFIETSNKIDLGDVESINLVEFNAIADKIIKKD